MTKIEIYDIDAQTLEELATDRDMTVAELIESVIEVIEDAVELGM